MTHRGLLMDRPNGRGVAAHLELSADHLAVRAETHTWRWGWDDVRIAPWDTTTVRLELPDGRFYYRADDPLRFTDALEQAMDDRTAPGHWWDVVFGSQATRPGPTGRRTPAPDEARPTTPKSAPRGPTLTERAAAIDLTDMAEPEPAPTPVRRRRLFGFGRPSHHTHRYSETGLSGGILRRVCDDCRHVSIDLRAPAG